jgi:glutamate-1-semialdehyde 2,1-aminomutase
MLVKESVPLAGMDVLFDRIPFMSKVRTSPYPQSLRWSDRAERSLAGGVSSQFRMSNDPHPMFYRRAEGAFVWDVDGNELLDYTLSQGPLILGHSHPAVLEAVKAAIDRGQLYAGQFEEEVVLAETLQRLIPSAEKVRFSSSGSEAVHAALRLARYVTGRPKVIKFEGHYHGWLDNVSFSVNPPLAEAGDRSSPELVPWGGGVPMDAGQDLIVLPWNDLAALDVAFAAHAGEIGAVITEPIMCNQGCIAPCAGFLEGLRSLCDREGAALIFDEIITGIRLDLGGAQRLYGVTPDLSIFGKALASGFPLSALVGRERFMAPLASNEVFHAGTLNANNASVAAALATLEVLEAEDGEFHEHLVQTGRALRDGLRAIADEHPLPIRVAGPGPMFHFGFTQRSDVSEYRHTLEYDAGRYQAFCRAMLALGVRLIGRGLWYVSAAHTGADVELTLERTRQALEGLA